MKTVILAAGKGTRLQPFTLTMPKPLLPVGGRPLLEWMLIEVKDAGIEEVLIVTNYMEEKVKEFFGDGSHFGLRISYIRQENMKGTADAFSRAESFVDGEDFLGLYGDHFYGEGILKKLVKAHKMGEATITTIKVEEPSHYGVLEVQNGLIREVIEKPDLKNKESQLVNAGVYVFPHNIFEFISKTDLSDRGEYEITDTLNIMAKTGMKVRPFKVGAGDWLDVGLPWNLLEANHRALTRIETKIEGVVEEGAVLHRPVCVCEGARVRSGTYVEGPVVIDEGSDVGPNCYIRAGTYLGQNTRVGNACEIKNSIVMEGTHIAHLSYVGDSIIGKNCNLGAGTITANLRFDNADIKVMVQGQRINSGRRKLGMFMGDNAQTGVNVCLWPGVIVGMNSWISPGVIITKNVPNSTFFKNGTFDEM